MKRPALTEKRRECVEAVIDRAIAEYQSMNAYDRKAAEVKKFGKGIQYLQDMCAWHRQRKT